MTFFVHNETSIRLEILTKEYGYRLAESIEGLLPIQVTWLVFSAAHDWRACLRGDHSIDVS